MTLRLCPSCHERLGPPYQTETIGELKVRRFICPHCRRGFTQRQVPAKWGPLVPVKQSTKLVRQ